MASIFSFDYARKPATHYRVCSVARDYLEVRTERENRRSVRFVLAVESRLFIERCLGVGLLIYAQKVQKNVFEGSFRLRDVYPIAES